MTENFEPKRLHGPMYAVIYPFMAMRAHECGYALAIHGSMARDFDLIAVPWTENAKSAEELVARILDVMDGTIFSMEQLDPTKPTEKPHGRRAYSMHLRTWTGNAYIDLSVMPRKEAVPV